MSENKRELVLNAFRGKTGSRVPVGFWFHFAHPETQDALENPDIIRQNVEGHKSYFEKFQPDFVKLMSDGYFNYPNKALSGSVKSFRELEGIESIGSNHRWINEQVELVKKQRAQFSYNPLTFYNIFSPATSVRFLLFGFDADGYKKLADLILEDKAAAKKVFDVVGKDLAEVAKRVVQEGGADGIYLSVQNIQDPRITKDIYDEVIRGAEVQILEAVNTVSQDSILHICGYEGARNDLSWYADYPVNAVNWAAKVEGIPLEEGRKIFAGKTIIGGFGNTKKDVLYSGTEEEIKKETERLLAGLESKDGVILGADCTIPWDIDLTHLEWVREAAAK